MIREIAKRMVAWDSPLLFTHWLLAFCFIGVLITQDSEKFRLVHVTMGYTMLGIVSFRLIWGFIGSKYARFETIKPRLLRAPKNIQSILYGKKQLSIGLNAIGYLAAYVLMSLIILVSASGHLIFNEIGPEIISEFHELIGNLLISVVVIHVGSILLNASYKYLQRNENQPHSDVGEMNQNTRQFRWVTKIIFLVVIYFWGIQFKIW